MPSLTLEARTGKVQSFGRGPRAGWAVVSDEDEAPAKPRPIQQPSLFDFTRGRHDTLILRVTETPKAQN